MELKWAAHLLQSTKERATKANVKNSGLWAQGHSYNKFTGLVNTRRKSFLFPKNIWPSLFVQQKPPVGKPAGSLIKKRRLQECIQYVLHQNSFDLIR